MHKYCTNIHTVECGGSLQCTYDLSMNRNTCLNRAHVQDLSWSKTFSRRHSYSLGRRVEKKVFVKCFMEVPLAYLGSGTAAAAVLYSPTACGTLGKHLITPFSQHDALDCKNLECTKIVEKNHMTGEN